MKPKWSNSAEKYFFANFSGGGGSPRWIAKTCCEVVAWMRNKDNPVVSTRDVIAGIEAYQSLHSGQQPFESLGVEIETSHPYRPLVTISDIGRIGGSSTSPAKQAASRENGKKGGRPRRVVKLPDD